MDDASDRGDPRAPQLEDLMSPDENPTPRSALIVGATGLVGGFLLHSLLEEDLYDHITALVRKPLARQHPKLKSVVTDFDSLDETTDAFQVDDVFCCLGTTIKTAGSQAAFRKVDYDYVATLARLGRSAGARRFLLISSIGADAGTSNFYLSVKGAAEDAVSACGYPEFHAFRPGQLTGPRRENRPAERAGIFATRFLTPLLVGGLRQYRPVHARTLALAMVGAARAGGDGRQIYTWSDIARLAEETGARSQSKGR
jgi:uncharacterized protein YbjT (DUF2867 family)